MRLGEGELRRPAWRRGLQRDRGIVPAVPEREDTRQARAQARKRRVRLRMERVHRQVGAVQQVALGAQGDGTPEGLLEHAGIDEPARMGLRDRLVTGTRSPRPYPRKRRSARSRPARPNSSRIEPIPSSAPASIKLTNTIGSTEGRPTASA
jgi:hypothetical protein